MTASGAYFLKVSICGKTSYQQLRVTIEPQHEQISSSEPILAVRNGSFSEFLNRVIRSARHRRG